MIIQKATKNYLKLARIGGLCLRPRQELNYLAKMVTNKRKYRKIDLTIYNTIVLRPGQ